jgi:Zn-dependent oligopeptidase
MKNLTLSILILLFIGCSSRSDTNEMTADNPFNISLNEPVDYAKVTGDHIDELAEVTIENVRRGIEKIRTSQEPTFGNTFSAYDGIVSELTKATNNSFMLYWVSPDSLVRTRGLASYQKLDSMNTSLSSDKLVFERFQAFLETDEYGTLTGHKKRLVDDTMDNFKQSGVNLKDEDLEKFKSLKAEISELTSQYSINMNTADLVVRLDEDGSEGLPESFKDNFRTDDGSYEIPVISATRRPVMRNARNEATRKAYYEQYYNRGSDKNLDILDQLVSKRYDMAGIMGFESFAAYNLKLKMAKTPSRVWEFIDDLVNKSKEKALKDLSALKDIRNREAKIQSNEPPNPWDIAYYNNQILKTQYNVDHELIRNYLPMDDCLSGMFEIYQQLLGLEFRKLEDAAVWHEEVETYEVYESDRLVGRFYLDLFPRPNKESWFYGVPLNYGRQTDSGYEIPVSMLLGNFTRPTDSKPSLLSHRELSTLFHEFGHIVDGMSYKGEFSLQSYSKADFAEAMSQIFENWIWDYEILNSFAKHYETGEVLPKEMFDNMVNAKNVSSGLNAQGSLRACIYDMNLYDKYDPAVTLDTDDLWRKIDEEMGVMNRYVEGTHPQANWIHINTHPVYMYGYLWAEVFAQDMFTVFEKSGLRDPETGLRYRNLILANGSQRDILEAVEEFLGRPSNNDAYIKSLGLE